MCVDTVSSISNNIMVILMIVLMVLGSIVHLHTGARQQVVLVLAIRERICNVCIVCIGIVSVLYTHYTILES